MAPSMGPAGHTMAVLQTRITPMIVRVPILRSHERERVEASDQSPQASTLYTKIAKSAKKELEEVSAFALFAILV
jgi:hypothetical protein